MEVSKFKKYHLPCPECNSSDALSVNEDGSAKCFSCDKFFPKFEQEETFYTQTKKEVSPLLNVNGSSYASISDRCIGVETAKKYGVKVVYDSQGKIAQHIYPYFINHEHTANKIRYTRDKLFKCQGTIQDTGLFGQHLFKEGGKFLTITEGEIDSLSAFELMGSKWPCVSIKRGASSAVKDIKENLEYVESFENIVICFDNDNAGKKAAKQVASILKPGKAKIMSLPNGFKDANDMLKKKKFEQFTRAWWDAQVYTPSGIIRVSEKKEQFFNREKKESVPYPWEGLNKKLLGLRMSELVCITGGTGLGKSSVTRELEHWIINQTEDNVGIIALEEDWRRTVDGVLSIEADARLYIDHIRDEFTQESLEEMFDRTFGKDRVFVHAHFGTNDIDAIFSKLRYLIVGCDCKWVIVDHLHMLVSALGEGDERRGIDNIMTRLRSMVEETGAGIVLVSHLRRVDGNKGHENGIEVSLSHLRGSNSIAQLSDSVISLERNQQSENELEARTTKVRVLKSRYTGDVGLATSLVYDSNTGRLSELDISELEVNEDFPF